MLRILYHLSPAGAICRADSRPIFDQECKNMNWQSLMNDITRDFTSALGDKLTGIYIHGSIAFGCFR